MKNEDGENTERVMIEARWRREEGGRLEGRQEREMGHGDWEECGEGNNWPVICLLPLPMRHSCFVTWPAFVTFIRFLSTLE